MAVSRGHFVKTCLIGYGPSIIDVIGQLCRVTMAHTIRCRIRTTALLERLGLWPINEYYNNLILRWAGHVARMDMNRIPRMLITGWVANPRPQGCPYMTWGRTLKKALKSFKISTDFLEWSKLAQDRVTWKGIIACGPEARQNWRNENNML